MKIRIVKKNDDYSLEYQVGDVFNVDSTWYGGANVTSKNGIPLSLDRDEYEEIIEKPAEDSSAEMPENSLKCPALMELMNTRRTYRRFYEEKKVSEEALQDILNAARLSSSAANRQPFTYIVVQEEKALEKVLPHTKWGGLCRPNDGEPKAGDRPVLFIALIENLKINPNAATDGGIILANMTLAAWNHGIGSCIFGALDREKLTELWNVREDQRIHTVIAFGYPKHESSIVDMEADGDTRYRMDDKLDYVIPKRRLEDVVTWYQG